MFLMVEHNLLCIVLYSTVIDIGVEVAFGD